MDRRNTNNSSIYFCYNNNNNINSNNINNINNNNNKIKQVWESSCQEDDDYYYVDNHESLMMLTWPPRSYTCSFCKREFRSAQALGGHMNVHRRDRAQLRQLSEISLFHNSSPSNISAATFNLNLPPNPNPTPPLTTRPAFLAMNIQPYLGMSTSSSSSSSLSSVVQALPPPLISKLPPQPDLITKKQFDRFKRQNKLEEAPPKCTQADNFAGMGSKRNEDGCLKKARGILRLDLEMNINVSDDGVFNQDLDLELRLGYN